MYLRMKKDAEEEKERRRRRRRRDRSEVSGYPVGDSGLPATGREAPQASARLPLLLSENKQTDIYLGDNVTTQSLFCGLTEICWGLKQTQRNFTMMVMSALVGSVTVGKGVEPIFNSYLGLVSEL